MSDPRQFCTLYLGEHLLGVDVRRIQEVIAFQPMTRVPLAPSVIRGLINLRGQIVTALDLRDRLAMPERAEGERPMNVVVHAAGGAVSLLVDRIGEVVEVGDSIMEAPPETLSGVARDLIRAVYKFEDRLLLELDVDRAISVGGALLPV